MDHLYFWTTVSRRAPRSGGGKYRRPVDIRVFAPSIQPTAYAKQGKGRAAIIHTQWGNVDRRYDGPKSAYGIAIAKAEKLCAELNDQIKNYPNQTIGENQNG
jgi:hypothetical protein